jgi:hypothetical protein
VDVCGAVWCWLGEQREEEEVAWAKSEEAKAAASGNGLRAAPLKFTFSIIHTIGRNLIFSDWKYRVHIQIFAVVPRNLVPTRNCAGQSELSASLFFSDVDLTMEKSRERYGDSAPTVFALPISGIKNAAGDAGA